MRDSSKRLFISSGLAVAAVSLAIGVPQLTRSQSPAAQVAERVLIERGVELGTVEDLENMRGQFLGALTNLYEVKALYGLASRDRATVENRLEDDPHDVRILNTMEAVQAMSRAELTILQDGAPLIRDFLNATSQLRRVAQQDRLATEQAEQAALHQQQVFGPGTLSQTGYAGSPLDCGPDPPATFPDAGYSFCGETRISTVAAQIALGVWEVADDLREFSQDGCKQTAVVAGVGGNASTACIIVDVAWVVAKFVQAEIDFCEGDIDSAEILGSYERLEHVNDDLTVAQYALDNKVEIRRVKMQVTVAKERLKYVITCEESGMPTDVEFTSIQVFDTITEQFVTLTQATIIQIDTGAYLCELGIPFNSVHAVFRLQCTDNQGTVPGGKMPGEPGCDHFGQIVFHRDSLTTGGQ
ncbi:MAG: hypothetical protein GY711_21725 [bacterium]|nr:hypothetical protein [bacterium]